MRDRTHLVYRRRVAVFVTLVVPPVSLALPVPKDFDKLPVAPRRSHRPGPSSRAPPGRVAGALRSEDGSAGDFGVMHSLRPQQCERTARPGPSAGDAALALPYRAEFAEDRQNRQVSVSEVI